MNLLPRVKFCHILTYIWIVYLVKCEEVPCIRKCCNVNETLEQDKCVSTDLNFYEFFGKLFKNDTPHLQVDVIVGDGCKYGRFRLEPHIDKDDEFILLKNGYLEIPASDEPPIDPTKYCLETFILEDESISVLPLICFPPPQGESIWSSMTRILYPIGCLISVPFLLMVIIMYVGISQHRDTYGKVVGYHCLCLGLAYISLVYVQIFGSELSSEMCICFAYIIQYSFLSCFIWLNVLCYHTWKKYTKKHNYTTSREQQKILFIKYNILAWGIPMVILCVTILMDYSPTIPSTYLKPNVGVDTCWFQGDKAVIPYFYGPISLALMINVVYFILTARFLHKNRQTSSMKNMKDVVMAVVINRREKIFIKCLILFCAMGLNWILEIISWLVGGPPQLWIITDIINTLQGPILFWAFVYKEERMWKIAREKFFKCCIKEDVYYEEPMEFELQTVN